MNDMEKYYRGVFENAGIGILVVDRDGRIVEANQALLSMLGYVEGDLSQCTFEEITHPDDREVSSRSLEALMSGEISSCRLEKRYLRKDGSTLWGDISTTSIMDANSKPVRAITVVADITKLKESEQALIDSEEHYRAVFENAGWE